MAIIKIIFKDLFFILKNLKSFLFFFNNRLFVILKKKFNYRSLINPNNLKYLNSTFDFILFSKNNSLYKLTSEEAKFFHYEFRNLKDKFDYNNSSYEDRNLFIIKHFIKNGDYVFDVGSHIGFYSMYLSKLVGPTGKVICLEPADTINQKLKSNFIINGYKNFKIYNCCAGEENGYCDFFEIDYDKFPEGSVNSATIINEKISSEYFSKKFNKKKKEIKTLDSIYINLINESSATYPNPTIKFIKIDTEGNEIDVLKGAKNIIKEFKPIILFEFHTKRVKYLNQNLDYLKNEILKYYFVYKIFIDLKYGAIALNKYDFSNLDDYEGDLICIPK